MLNGLQAEGQITQDEADALLAAYDAGEITAQDLPLAPREGSTSLPEALMLAALLDVLLGAGEAQGEARAFARLAARLRLEVARREATGRLLEEYQRDQAQRLLAAHGGGTAGPATGQTREQARAAGNRILRGLPFSRKRRLARDFADIFGNEANRRTDNLLFGNYNDGMRRWHLSMREAIRDDLMAMAAIGKGQPLDAADLNRLGVAWRKQQAHLQRFAEEITARREAGNPMTRKQIKARARMYGGAQYAAFWRFAGEEKGQGWVVIWHSQDDGGVCSRCLSADHDMSPLPAGYPHPVPGYPWCRGGGACRCWLTFRFDPEAFAEAESDWESRGEQERREYYEVMREDPLLNQPAGGIVDAGGQGIAL